MRCRVGIMTLTSLMLLQRLNNAEVLFVLPINEGIGTVSKL